MNPNRIPIAARRAIAECPSALLPLVLLAWIAIPPTAAAVDLLEDALTESSGLAWSLRSPKHVWSHNDSGGEPSLYAFDATTGKRTGACKLKDVVAVDWESMAAYVDANGRPKLIVADVGDNLARRPTVTLHVIDEPSPTESTVIDSDERVTVPLRHADGPVDCEAIAVHRPTSQLLLISKGRFPVAKVETVPLDRLEPSADTDESAGKTDVVTAQPLTTLAMPMITGVDVCGRTGNVWIASYFNVAKYSGADSREGLVESFAKVPELIAPPRLRQIEAIACDESGAVWVSSEGKPVLEKVQVKHAGTLAP